MTRDKILSIERMFITTPRIYQAPAEDPTDSRSGSASGPLSWFLNKQRKVAEDLAHTTNTLDTFYGRFVHAAQESIPEGQLPRIEQLQGFLLHKPSDKLIRACVDDLCPNPDRVYPQDETLSVYESLAKAKVDDRGVTVFQTLSRLNQDQFSSLKYARAQLVETVIVPLSRIQNLSDQLLTKVTNDLSFIIRQQSRDEAKLTECVRAASEIASIKPIPAIKRLYDDTLAAVCLSSSNEQRLNSPLGLQSFLEELSHLELDEDVQAELEDQINYTAANFGTQSNYLTRFLLPLIPSFLQFDIKLEIYPQELRENVVAKYNELVQLTKERALPLRELNNLFARGARDDFGQEDLDTVDSLYRSGLGQSMTGLAKLIAYTGDFAAELRRSYKDLVNKAVETNREVAQKLISNVDILLLNSAQPNPRLLLPMINCCHALIDSDNFRSSTVEVLLKRFLKSAHASYVPSNLIQAKYLSAIRAMGSDAQKLGHQLGLITSHDILMHNISNTGQVPHWDYFSSIFHNGDLPFRSGTPEHTKATKESQSILRASFNGHYGFGALANDAKGWKNSILARFGRDISCHEVQAPRCKDGNAFPGKGYVITGLNDDFLRIPDLERKLDGDQAYQDFLNHYPFLASVADDIDSTQFAFLRGMIVVTNIKNKYELPDKKGNMIPYALVIYNDHFHNNGYDIAYLVPSRILLEKIKPSLFSVYDTETPPQIPTDINAIPLDIESLREEAHAIKASIVNLGWSSNIAGLCNAWEPNHKPYHGWEASMNNTWRDLDGHKHKWFRLEIRGRNWDDTTERSMKPFQNQHKQVYGVAKSLFDNLNSFKLFLSAYKHGYLGNFDTQNMATAAGTTRTFSQSDDFEASSDNDMMFDQAYALREAALQRGANVFPKLVVYDTYKWSSEPIQGFELDLATMQLTIDGKTYQLHSDKPRASDRALWRQAFNQFAGLEYDFRFYEEGLNQ
ncbi:MAG: hypothetical protein O3C63_07920 [Cyanobacteria bacterium]|nr:hypothetical protein [Cyanobacteriota bacterium]